GAGDSGPVEGGAGFGLRGGVDQGGAGGRGREGTCFQGFDIQADGGERSATAAAADGIGHVRLLPIAPTEASSGSKDSRRRAGERVTRAAVLRAPFMGRPRRRKSKGPCVRAELP